MKIYSIKNGFTSDHSSTSYEFLAVDKPLTNSEKEEVSKLSRRASPTSYRVGFSYNVEGYDIPGGYEKLMEKYYDVMYSEDYDWWTFAIAFNTNSEQFNKLKEFEFRGYEDLGVDIEGNSDRVLINIYCVVDYEELETVSKRYLLGSRKVGRDDGLLKFLSAIRQQFIDGDYRVLHALWEKYNEDDAFIVPETYEKEQGSEIVEDFTTLLSYLD